MNLEMYLNELNYACNFFDIDPADVTVSHGGASLFHGLRDSTNDIDVSVSKESYQKVLNAGYKPSLIPALGDLPAWELISFGNVDFHLHRHVPETIMLHGFKVTTKLQLLKDRIDLGRKQDISDINLMKELHTSLDSVYKHRLWLLQNDSAVSVSAFVDNLA